MSVREDLYPFGPRYRPCVGMMILNRDNSIFLGKRAGLSGDRYAWQMPQGGIDGGETTLEAAWRELHEETSISNAEVIAEASEWHLYDLPQEALDRWKGKYIGQAQKWFLFRFTGQDTDIDLAGHEQVEFVDWQWSHPRKVPDLVVPFKKQVYVNVIREFGQFWKPPAVS